MKWRLKSIVALLMTPATVWAGVPASTTVMLRTPAVVAFSPNGGGTRLVIGAIRTARKSVDVQAYEFTSVPIARALIRASRRGVHVQVILDQVSLRHGGYYAVRLLNSAGIPLWEDNTVKIAHSKVMILDHAGIITGSFNFTYAAARDNSENVLWIQHAPALAAAYLQDFQWRRSVSVPLNAAAQRN
ncbi:MAG: phospholipase D family nuclease [Acidobacteriaceae bacterium]